MNLSKYKNNLFSKNLLKKWINKLISFAEQTKQLNLIRNDLLLQQLIASRVNEHPNPLVKYGKKCFSQMDEDGITLEIINRLGLKQGSFIELGVGNGLENNTLILASIGWKGIWIGAEELAFNYKESTKFKYYQQWISLDNICSTIKKGLLHLNQEKPDVISLDLDGNDWFFVESILKNNIHPELFIVEYNAKFPPPVEFCIDYHPNNFWRGDDYFGASLSSFVNLFERYDYSLICCNAGTGANAFFIKNTKLPLFPEVPRDINKIYVSPQYNLLNRFGHPPSSMVIEKIFQDQNN